MFEVATLSKNHTLELPPDIASKFQTSDKFIVWMANDTIHFKRVESSPLDALDNAPNDEPMSLDEIDGIVHEVRQRRKQS